MIGYCCCEGLGFNKSLGRGRALVLPAWMTVPGGIESAEMAAESELMRLQQSVEEAEEAEDGGSDTIPIDGQGRYN